MSEQLDPEHSRNIASNLIQAVESQRDLMVAVSTGGPRIDEVNEAYKERCRSIVEVLEILGLQDVNPFHDLWEWYGKWSSGDLPTYRSRRLFLREMHTPLISQLEDIAKGVRPSAITEPTGWHRVDRAVEKMRIQLARAQDEEDYQQIGLLGREIFISLGQAVFDPNVHSTPNGIGPSTADAAGMLAAYIDSELGSKANKRLRLHSKASLDLAVALQHKRTAEFRIAAISAEAVVSFVNIIAIVSGRRDPD